MTDKQPTIEIAIGIVDGVVVLKLPHALEHIEFDAQNAIDIGEALAAAAFQLREGIPPAGPALKAALVERIRDTLIARVALMLGSMREDATQSNGKVAMAIVDACLREVF